MNWEALEATASSITALGVLLAAGQLRLTKKQSVTRFEDDLTREYRDLIKTISIKALLGKELTETEFSEAYPALFHYIDLSNEQAFLWEQKRITEETWKYWCDGIKSNLSRPAFKRAWDEIKTAAPDSFAELRRLETSGFQQ